MQNTRWLAGILGSAAVFTALVGVGAAQNRIAAGVNPSNCTREPWLSPLGAPSDTGDYWGAVASACDKAAKSAKLISDRAYASYFIGRAHLGLAQAAGSVTEKQQEFQKADDSLAEALRDMPNLGIAKLNRARALEGLPRYAEALQVLNSLTDPDPGEGPAADPDIGLVALEGKLERARIQQQTGDRDTALISFRDVWKSPQPLLAPPKNNRGKPPAPSAADTARYNMARGAAEKELGTLVDQMSRPGLQPNASRDQTQQALKALAVGIEVNREDARAWVNTGKAQLHLAVLAANGPPRRFDCGLGEAEQAGLMTAQATFLEAQRKVFPDPALHADAFSGAGCTYQAEAPDGPDETSQSLDRINQLMQARDAFTEARRLDPTPLRSLDLARTQRDLARSYIAKARLDQAGAAQARGGGGGRGGNNGNGGNGGGPPRNFGPPALPPEAQSAINDAVESFQAAVQGSPAGRPRAEIYLEIADLHALMQDIDPDSGKREFKALSDAAEADRSYSVPAIRLGRYLMDEKGGNSPEEARRKFEEVRSSPSSEQSDKATADLYLSKFYLEQPPGERGRNDQRATAARDFAEESLRLADRSRDDYGLFLEQACLVRIRLADTKDEGYARCFNLGETSPSTLLLTGLFYLRQVKGSGLKDQLRNLQQAKGQFSTAEALLGRTRDVELNAKLEFGLAQVERCLQDPGAQGRIDRLGAAASDAAEFYRTYGLSDPC